jgi:hypothetical protein
VMKQFRIIIFIFAITCGLNLYSHVFAVANSAPPIGSVNLNQMIYTEGAIKNPVNNSVGNSTISPTIVANQASDSTWAPLKKTLIDNSNLFKLHLSQSAGKVASSGAINLWQGKLTGTIKDELLKNKVGDIQNRINTVRIIRLNNLSEILDKMNSVLVRLTDLAANSTKNTTKLEQLISNAQKDLSVAILKVEKLSTSDYLIVLDPDKTKLKTNILHTVRTMQLDFQDISTSVSKVRSSIRLAIQEYAKITSVSQPVIPKSSTGSSAINL